MNLTKIISIVLFIVSIGLAYYLYDSINSTIETNEKIAATERLTIDKLEIIREAEKAFLEQNGRYTASWDSLINFIKNGVVPITVRTETIIPKSYGEEEVIVKVDTIGQISAQEKIFKKNYTVNAADNGTFLSFYVKEGDRAIKGGKSYRMRKDGNEKADEYSFLESGTINSLSNIRSGDKVTKGQLLITFWDYYLNTDIDINTLNKVPGSGETFEIYVGKIDRNGIKVNVIEVKDPKPINPARKASNEAKNRQPLQFGSKTDVTTAGNWEW